MVATPISVLPLLLQDGAGVLISRADARGRGLRGTERVIQPREVCCILRTSDGSGERLFLGTVAKRNWRRIRGRLGAGFED